MSLQLSPPDLGLLFTQNDQLILETPRRNDILIASLDGFSWKGQGQNSGTISLQVGSDPLRWGKLLSTHNALLRSKRCSPFDQFHLQVGSELPTSGCIPTSRYLKRRHGDPNNLDVSYLRDHFLNITKHQRRHDRSLYSSPACPRPRWLRRSFGYPIPVVQSGRAQSSRNSHDKRRTFRGMALHPHTPQAIPALASRPISRNLGCTAPPASLESRPHSLRKELFRLRTP